MQIEEKKMRQKEVEAKGETLLKCFHSFKYVIDHVDVHFFFYVNSLQFTALCDSFCTFCIFSAQIPWQLSQVYNHLYSFFSLVNKLFKNLPLTL